MTKNNLWDIVWNGPTKTKENTFNKVFYQMIGGMAAKYDNNATTYLEKGYRINPDVFSVITQMCDKSKAVPYAVKKVKDPEALAKINKIRNATKGNYSIKQMADLRLLERKAYEDKEQPFPLSKPNPNNTWADIVVMFKLFYRLTGDVYLWKAIPEEGVDKGKPIMLYTLPSHKMEIVLKENADLLYDANPIDYFMYVDGGYYNQFRAEEIIHIKTPNPFFDQQGSHLYGLSPMSALLKNLQSSNGALDANVDMIDNKGIFGLITGTEKHPLTPAQAIHMKEQLIEMDRSHGKLSKISATSAPIEFTKLSLDTNELRQFDFLKYDQKQICNVLGWSDSLLNNDDGGKYDKQKEERKRVITDNIHPDLMLLAEALSEQFIKLFPGYEDSKLEFDISELPEMQEDYKIMLDWMERAYYTPNEIRTATKAESLDIDGANVPWIDSNKKRMDEISLNESDFEKAYGKNGGMI